MWVIRATSLLLLRFVSCTSVIRSERRALNQPSLSLDGDCPRTFIYDIPELWDFPTPLAELYTLPRHAFGGRRCGSSWLSEQYALSMIMFRRLMSSKRCPVTRDPSTAELFLVPFYPMPKNQRQWGELCGSRDEGIEHLLKHLNTNTAHRHVFLFGKGHVNLPPIGQCRWWSKPKGLLQHAIRTSYSVVLRGADGNGGDYSSGYGPDRFDQQDWPWQRFVSMTSDLSSDRVPYPHAVSVPYPAITHEPGSEPWKDLSDRPLLVTFAGGLHGKYGLQLRKKIVEDCNQAGDCKLGLCIGLLRNHQASPKEADDCRCAVAALKRQALFCLEPGGDSPYRKSVFDDIAMGCIPVVFSPYLRLVAPWHWGHFRNDSSVYIDQTDYLEGRLNLLDELRKLASTKRVMQMRKAIALHGHATQFALEDYPGDAVEQLLQGAAEHARKREASQGGRDAHISPDGGITLR